MSHRILEGIRVLEVGTGIAAPFATMILGDLGADVIKVERPAGDSMRAPGDVAESTDTPASFVSYNRNKRGIALDLTTDEGRRVLSHLADKTDVLVQNWRTGVLKKWGLDYPRLSARNPQIVYCSITGFGSEGPLATKAGNDIVIQAASGLMSMTGSRDQPPVRLAGLPADQTSGIYAALAVVSALYYRQVSGKGQTIDVSLMDTALSLAGRAVSEYITEGSEPHLLDGSHQTRPPNGALPAKDGWIVVAANNQNMYARMCEALGIPELITDPRFATGKAREENALALIKALGDATSKMTRSEAEAVLDAHGVSVGQVRTIPEVASDPALRSSFVKVPVSGTPGVTVVASPMHFSATPTRVFRPSPRLNENCEEILLEEGL